MSKQSLNNSNINQSVVFNEMDVSPIKLDDNLLPGEVIHPVIPVDQLLIAYAPYPTNKPVDVLPRYLMRMEQLDNDETEPIDFTIKTYFEGKLLTLNSGQPTIWLKPNFVVP